MPDELLLRNPQLPSSGLLKYESKQQKDYGEHLVLCEEKVWAGAESRSTNVCWGIEIIKKGDKRNEFLIDYCVGSR